MSRRPFDPDELPGVEGLDEVTAELDRYADATAGPPPADLGSRIMAAVGAEPLPRRTAIGRLAALFATPGPMRRPVQAVALVAILALGVGGALLAGGVIGQLREFQVGTSPSPEATTSPSPTIVPSPSPTIVPSPSPEPTRSPSPSASPSPEVTAPPSLPTPGPTATDDHGDDSPRPTASDDDGGGNSGPGGGGGDD